MVLTTRTSAVVLLTALLLVPACRIERTERPALSSAATLAQSVIMVTLEDYEAAIASGDPRRAASFFAPDGTLTINGSAELHGRPDIAAHLEERMDGTQNQLVLHSEVIELTTGAAWQIGTFDQTTPADSAAVPVRGRFMIRWLPGPEATWRIHHLMLSTFPVDSATPPDSEAPAPR